MEALSSKSFSHLSTVNAFSDDEATAANPPKIPPHLALSPLSGGDPGLLVAAAAGLSLGVWDSTLLRVQSPDPVEIHSKKTPEKLLLQHPTDLVSDTRVRQALTTCRKRGACLTRVRHDTCKRCTCRCYLDSDQKNSGCERLPNVTNRRRLGSAKSTRCERGKPFLSPSSPFSSPLLLSLFPFSSPLSLFPSSPPLLLSFSSFSLFPFLFSSCARALGLSKTTERPLFTFFFQPL